MAGTSPAMTEAFISAASRHHLRRTASAGARGGVGGGEIHAARLT